MVMKEQQWKTMDLFWHLGGIIGDINLTQIQSQNTNSNVEHQSL